MIIFIRARKTVKRKILKSLNTLKQNIMIVFVIIKIF